MLRLIFYVLFIFLGYKVFRWALRFLDSGESNPLIRGHQDRPAVDDLVKDPVCGVYVPVKTAISTIVDGKQVYFCSENCRKRYLDS